MQKYLPNVWYKSNIEIGLFYPINYKSIGKKPM